MSVDMRPDYWKPSWIAHQRFDGKGVALCDMSRPSATECPCVKMPPHRWVVTSFVIDDPANSECIHGLPLDFAEHVYLGDSLTEAEAAFEAACVALREEGA